MRECSESGCTQPTVGRGLCRMHYSRWHRHGSTAARSRKKPPRPCLVEGCDKPFFCQDLCGMHYSRWKNHGTTDAPVRKVRAARVCSVEGCNRPYLAQGWCSLHHNRVRRLGRPGPARSVWEVAAAERFWRRVTTGEPGDCWGWAGKPGTGGYGRIRDDENRSTPVHRFSYELLRGPIPDGLSIDHLCRNRNCVNPFHLEAVPIGVNVLRGEAVSAVNKRKTHCIRGHPLSGDNLKVSKTKYGWGRSCRACVRIRSVRYNRSKLAAQ